MVNHSASFIVWVLNLATAVNPGTAHAVTRLIRQEELIKPSRSSSCNSSSTLEPWRSQSAPQSQYGCWFTAGVVIVSTCGHRWPTLLFRCMPMANSMIISHICLSTIVFCFGAHFQYRCQVNAQGLRPGGHPLQASVLLTFFGNVSCLRQMSKWRFLPM